jgi:hypothetical protein
MCQIVNESMSYLEVKEIINTARLFVLKKKKTRKYSRKQEENILKTLPQGS